MKRKPLTLDDKASVFNQFQTKENNDKEATDKLVIEKLAEVQGFTKREFTKKKSVYIDQFNARCKEGVNDLTNDILYFKKIKKQELLELALLAYLEKEKMDSLLSKYHDIIK